MNIKKLEEINNLAKLTGLCAEVMTLNCHALAKHWWVNKDGSDIRENPLSFSNKLCLIHSEISEAMEGDRKNKMDDHLPSNEAY